VLEKPVNPLSEENVLKAVKKANEEQKALVDEYRANLKASDEITARQEAGEIPFDPKPDEVTYSCLSHGSYESMCPKCLIDHYAPTFTALKASDEKQGWGCPPHNLIPYHYEGAWGGSVSPPNMKCTKCLIELRF